MVVAREFEVQAPPAVAGLVLCGGRSRRMGRDKALIPWRGELLVRRAALVLGEVAEDVRLACGPSPRYADLGFDLVLDRVEGSGPLGGIEAALATLRPADRLVCVACDMPALDAHVVRVLLERATSDDLDVCCLATPAGLEPLHSVWRGSMLAAVRMALDLGDRRVVAAFDHATSDGRAPRVGTVSVGELADPRQAERSAWNVNTPDDLARLEAHA